MSMVGAVGREAAGRREEQGVPPTALQAAIRAVQKPEAVAGPAAGTAGGAGRELDLTV